MKIKIKLQILVCILLIALPTVYLLYKIINLSINENEAFLFKYIIFTLICWIALSPVLLNLLNIAAKQIADYEIKKWKDDRDTV